MEKLTAEEFTTKFGNFLTSLQKAQEKIVEERRLTEQESIVDLFRLWFMDSREVEAFEEATSQDRGF